MLKRKKPLFRNINAPIANEGKRKKIADSLYGFGGYYDPKTTKDRKKIADSLYGFGGYFPKKLDKNGNLERKDEVDYGDRGSGFNKDVKLDNIIIEDKYKIPKKDYSGFVYIAIAIFIYLIIKKK